MKEKIILIPAREHKELKAITSWVVKWTSRDGIYNTDTEQEFEVFLSEKDADIFAIELRKAFKLIRHTSNTEVTVKKNKV